MKLYLKPKMRANTNDVIANIVLQSMSKAIQEIHDDVLKAYKDSEGYLDVRMTIEGHEIDVESFCMRWQKDVRRQIREEAKNLVDLNFSDIYNVLYDLETRMKEEVSKRLEEWEKEE